MNIPAELDAIRERHEAMEQAIRAQEILARRPSHQDRARLLHVLDEVLEVHRPTDMFEDKVCAECLEYDPSCPSGPAPWPCFTVRTIAAAMNK